MPARFLACLTILAAFALGSCGMMEDYSAAQQFADETVRVVVSNWDQEALVSRFAEPALEGTTDEDLDTLFEVYRRGFGEALNIEPAVGQVKAQSRVGTDGSGSAMIGVFTAPIEFDLRDGEATVTVQKFETGWLVTDFRLRSTSPAKADSTGTEEPAETVEV
jgi:hypothetical protein